MRNCASLFQCPHRANVAARSFAVFALLVAASPSVAAAQQPDLSRPAREPTIEALVFDVAGGPAEFSADLLIRLAGSPAVADPEWKRELLETAFLRAYGVHDSHKRAAPGAAVDSRAGGFTRAYATGLDALTLQVRAVLGMIPLDPARARELFEWIDFYLPPASCSDLLIPVADEYYAALGTIARRTFPPAPTAAIRRSGFSRTISGAPGCRRKCPPWCGRCARSSRGRSRPATSRCRSAR